MPAERSRGSRRSGADGNQLVWTMPVEPASQSGIAFTTNLTPITFSDPDLGAIAAGTTPESDLFPSADPSSPRRPAHSKKKAENHIPRPPNAFILFRSSFIKSQHVSTEVETNHSTLSKIIGLTWQNLPEDERQVWHGKAKAALDEHKRKFPQYAFRPLHSKSKGGTEKRKVREVGPKDLKRCAKIAELLVEGKKGQELDAAIQEFDKHHVPEVVTRFEAPITEQTFQRSSFPTVKVEDSDMTEPAVISPYASPPCMRASRSASVDRSRTQSRSTSPGPPPPLIDPDDVPQYLLAQSYSLQKQLMSNYGLESSFDPNTFAFDPIMPTSFSPSSTTSSAAQDSLLSEDSISNAFSMFEEASCSLTERRPSLSVDTSYSEVSVLPMMDDWTRSSSPMSATNMSIPSTPCYPASPMPGQYGAAFTSYKPTHALRHTASSLSLESTTSFESTSSFEDFSTAYSNDYRSLNASTMLNDYHQYTGEPIFIAGSEMSEALEFATGPYGSKMSSYDDISLAKAQAQTVQFRYHTGGDSFIDFNSTFISSPGHC